MSKRTTQTLYSWNDPETKLRFLEVSLQGKTWNANILIPPEMRSPSDIARMKQQLESRGYVVEQDQDMFKAPVLRVTHIGSDTGLIENLQSLGLVRGSSKTLENIGSALSNTLSRAYDYAKHVSSDSARMIGAVYLVGDAAVTVSPFLNKQTSHQASTGSGLSNMLREMKDPYNLMQLGQGVSTVLHSLIFMHYAEDGKGVLLKDLEQQVKNGGNGNQQASDPSTWSHEGHGGLLGSADRFMRKNAIGVGSGVIIAGQIGYILGGFTRFAKWSKELKALEDGVLAKDTQQYLEHFNPKPDLSMREKIEMNRKAGLLEVGRGSLSAATWSTFIYNSKEHPEKPDWLANPMKRAFDEFEENPQRAASVMSFLSSSMGMMAGSNKGNHVQKYGEAIYFIADGLMFFTKKKHYGKEDASQDSTMIEAASTLIERAPFAFSPQALGEFSQKLAAYMIAHDAPSPANEAAIDNERVATVKAGIEEAIATKTTPYTKLVTAAAKLCEHIPAESRDGFTGQLAAILSHHDNIFASKEDLVRDIADRLPHMDVSPAQKPDISQLLPALTNLAYAVPGLDSADTAIALFELTSQQATQQPDSKQQFTRQMQAVAAQAMQQSQGTQLLTR